MNTSPRSFRRASATIVALAAVAACGGGGEKTSATTTAAPATTAAPSTTSSSAPPTTAAAVTTAAASTTATTAAPAGPTYPLTGLAAADPAKLNRPAVVVKVNNVASARPQFGLNAADVVFEERIGTTVTRLFAVYQSEDSDKVGSIRSARASDLPILAALSKPLFAWSGANENLSPAIGRAAVTDAGYSRHSDLYARGRRLPDYTEFFVATEEIRTLTPEGQGAPAPIFTFRKPGEPTPPGGAAARGATWAKAGYDVAWEWDGASARWLRSQSGTPHVDAAGDRIGAQNVVLMLVNYKAAFDDPRSPEAVTTGKGRVWILVDGVAIPGNWERAKATDAFAFTDDTGKVIPLTPGKTWVELADDDAVTIDR